ncbi:hypothetical protein HS088_TW15G01349 [Tripterygium wilfordii]|uniref:Protein LAZY 1-like n=1 Tax=Tripterygium wilfordii TaxID=458696 RepID=A0A7J7CP17_TRIWF|nr:hypothetical protein HS088_TW15G01349 [Tripterygium wilfordii]
MQEIFEEGTSIINSELFHGFLAIGTLGLEPMTSDPATPTFPGSLENITEKETEATENDLKLINDELEKFLAAEAEGEQSNESSRRNSYVSTITLSGKQIEGIHAEDFGKMVVCPLQGYLFGSSIDLPETRSEPKKEKATLGELFLKTTLTEEHSIKERGKQAKQTHKSAKKIITKMLKKLHVSSKSSNSCSRNEATDPIPTKTRLQKVSLLKIKFHKHCCENLFHCSSQKHFINITAL